MSELKTLDYTISDPIELNLSYIPFITNGGLFIPSQATHEIGDHVIVNLQLSNRKDSIKIEGKVIWITPTNALHHVLPGIGIQFIGSEAQTVHSLIETQLDKSIEMGGYVYGITESR